MQQHHYSPTVTVSLNGRFLVIDTPGQNGSPDECTTVRLDVIDTIRYVDPAIGANGATLLPSAIHLSLRNGDTITLHHSDEDVYGETCLVLRRHTEDARS